MHDPTAGRDAPRPTPGPGAASGIGPVAYFGATRVDGSASLRDELGGKGANLAEMTSIGLPVPPGFTITASTCAAFHDAGGRLPDGLMDEVHANVAALETELGKRFGDDRDPLLVSVRSGAAVSMPGMMDTILNLGLTDAAVDGLAEQTGARRFVFDALRRLISMFGEVVMGVKYDRFEEAFDEIKRTHGAEHDADVPEAGMAELCEAFKAVYRREVGAPFPQDPVEQLRLAIEAVFRSWNSPKAVSYRRIEGIKGLQGTAVNVQAMVYGNMGDDSGTGVAFTRNPSTGENVFFGEFLVNAQGEDVVAGIRTPKSIAEMAAWDGPSHRRLLDIKTALEAHYKDMQDVEFTIERGRLFMLQTRTGKRTGPAAIKIACDMVDEGVITEDEALLRIPAAHLTQLLLPSFDPVKRAKAHVLCKGLPASPGAAVGRPAFTSDEVVERAGAGERVILVRKETSPEDVEGMHAAAGILTSHGGMTSHAAVVARGWGKCCVAGAGDLYINAGAGAFTVRGETFGRDDVISIDGATGEVIAGALDTVEPELSGDFARVMDWADARRTMGVRTNADTPRDAAKARAFGAEGIGLARTEHMFFEDDRITSMRRMILAESTDDRERALAELLPHQRADFKAIFEAMHALPVTVRLLDPPLHEFLPHDEETQREVAASLGDSVEHVQRRVNQLREQNPMLGHRGCRLAVTFPEILRMQVRAIVEAAAECVEAGIDARPEIMIPLVGEARELGHLRVLCEQTIAAVRAEHARAADALEIKIGTMIEIPRAALTAADVAAHADFFSFGTNDLTQLTFGYSRDDANMYLPHYIEHGLLPDDPFQALDEPGVGRLIHLASADGRAANPDLKLGLCGEHGGDPASVDFCQRVGLEYISCSPFRVPIARLAAAQAAIRAGSEGLNSGERSSRRASPRTDRDDRRPA